MSILLNSLGKTPPLIFISKSKAIIALVPKNGFHILDPFPQFSEIGGVRILLTKKIPSYKITSPLMAT